MSAIGMGADVMTGYDVATGNQQKWASFVFFK